MCHELFTSRSTRFVSFDSIGSRRNPSNSLNRRAVMDDKLAIPSQHSRLMHFLMDSSVSAQAFCSEGNWNSVPRPQSLIVMRDDTSILQKT